MAVCECNNVACYHEWMRECEQYRRDKNNSEGWEYSLIELYPLYIRFITRSVIAMAVGLCHGHSVVQLRLLLSPIVEGGR